MSDLAPGASESIDVKLQTVQMGQQLSDRIVGPVNYGESGPINEGAARLNARNTIINQLTFDPAMGFTGQLPDGRPGRPGLGGPRTAAGRDPGRDPAPDGNVLWFLPTELSVSGTTTFRNDLLRSTVIKSDAAFFSKDPFTINFGRGSAELSYRPIAFDGTLTATELAIGLNFGDPGFTVDPKPIEPLPSIPEPCDEVQVEDCQGRTSTGCRRSSCSTSPPPPGSACPTSTPAPSTPSPSPPATWTRRRAPC